MNNNKLFNEIAKKINPIFREADRYMSVYEISREEAEDEIYHFTKLKEEAIQGVKPAWELIISKYTILISSKIFNISDNEMKEIFDFDDIQNNSVQVLLEMLLSIYDISEIIDRYVAVFWRDDPENLYRITEQNIRDVARNEENKIKQEFSGRTKRFSLLARFIYSREYGQDCIDSLQYQHINEIGVLNREYIYIVGRGNKIRLEFLSFENKETILNIQKKTTANAKPGYDQQNPAVVASKNSGSRITVAGFDATPAEEDLYYNERIFNLTKITLEEMRDRYGTIDEMIYKLLCLNQKGKGSYFITGADMGVGKSTFLLAMLEKTPNNWGIGILDIQNELQAQKKYPWKNIITLIQNPRKTVSELFAVMLSMARDILVVGEIALPPEVSELINAALRLNAGVGATMHSMSPEEVVPNIRNLMMLTEMYNDAEVAESDIARGLDLIIHLVRHPVDRGRIVVESVVEIQSVEQDVFWKANMEGSLKEKINNIADMVQLALQKFLFKRSYRYSYLVKYDFEKDCWKALNRPSHYYIGKLSRYVDKKEISEFINAAGW